MTVRMRCWYDYLRISPAHVKTMAERRAAASFRPGTGSAMYYIWLASGHAGMREPVVAATADGRLRGSAF